MLDNIFTQSSPQTVEIAIFIMRLGIGILTMLHGYPKMFGGPKEWQMLGTTFMGSVGIHFLPIMWGFLGGVTEFFGGIALAAGVGTRIASFALIIMMIIATAWHIKRGDHFNTWSFPAALIFVYLFFFIVGDYGYSLMSLFR